MKRSPDKEDVKLAMAQSTTSGALVGTAVDAHGYGRAKFVFTFGTPLVSVSAAKINASSIGIWNAAGSNSSVVGATTYASIPSAFLAAATTGAISNNVFVIDLAVQPASRFLLISGTVDSSSIPMSATVELYEPVNAPPTLSATTVIVN